MNGQRFFTYGDTSEPDVTMQREELRDDIHELALKTGESFAALQELATTLTEEVVALRTDIDRLAELVAGILGVETAEMMRRP